MADKKNFCAQISTELHCKATTEKENLQLQSLGEYLELVLTERFEGGNKMSMTKGKVLAITLPPELEARLDAYVKAEEERQEAKRIRQACAIKLLEMGLDAAGF